MNTLVTVTVTVTSKLDNQ